MKRRAPKGAFFFEAHGMQMADALRADGQGDIAGTWDEEYRLTMEAVSVQ